MTSSKELRLPFRAPKRIELLDKLNDGFVPGSRFMAVRSLDETPYDDGEFFWVVRDEKPNEVGIRLGDDHSGVSLNNMLSDGGSLKGTAEAYQDIGPYDALQSVAVLKRVRCGRRS